MIYLASPFTHFDPAVRQWRFEAACRAAAALITQGKTVFSPIAHSFGICAFGIPHDWHFWQRHDRRYLDVCDEVVVLMLDGWRESVGVQAEIIAARELGKPVKFLTKRGAAEKETAGE
jgi:nucleoside 2-deoxyribosyltransferase